MCEVELEAGRWVADDWRMDAWVVPSRVEWGWECAVAHIIHTVTKDSEQHVKLLRDGLVVSTP